MSSAVRLEVETPQGRQTIVVSPRRADASLADILREKHLPLNTRCGQRGLCDGCLVELLEGKLVRITTGQPVAAGTAPVAVRGCEYRVVGAAHLRIPPRSLLAYEPQVISDFRINVPRAHDPLWQNIRLAREEVPKGKLTPQNLGDAVARHCKRRRPVMVAPQVAERLVDLTESAEIFVSLEYRRDHWLLTNVAHTPPARALGAAVDVGTTTVAVLLADLTNGKIVARAADFNRQMHFGDDVLTRINLCSRDASMLRQLQEAVVDKTVVPLLREVLGKANAAADQLECVTVAGNTTMLHLFAGVDPTPMGVAPFTPAFLEHRILSPSDSPLSSHFPAVSSLHLLPGAAAYVGADLCAGIFATGLVYDEGPNLLVDVGTNGEIILKHGGRLFGCATAAGPAFEGAGLSCGMRAGDGAISDIRLSKSPFSVRVEVIGEHNGAKPAGLCGSAYIDFLAQARGIGLLTPTGRFNRTAIPEAEDLLNIRGDGSLALRIAYGAGKQEIVISELDVARLLQAKAAIAAGTLTLLERVELTPRDIKKVYLAGGFGMHIEPSYAIGCGLLPGFVPEQIEIVGNTSLAGAYLALLDCGALEELANISKKLDIIELNLDPGFESRYIDQLTLPD